MVLFIRYYLGDSIKEKEVDRNGAVVEKRIRTTIQAMYE